MIQLSDCGFSCSCFSLPAKMWKLLTAAAIVIMINLGEGQRSSYAPRPGSNSKLLPRFRKNETDAGLGSRGGQEDSDTNSTSTLSPELQGTLEDHRFVHRVSQWPEERQPFWFKNRYAISSMRDRNIDGGNVNRPSFESQRPRPQFRSSFQSPNSDRGGGRVMGNAEFAPNDVFGEGFLNEPPFYLRRTYTG